MDLYFVHQEFLNIASTDSIISWRVEQYKQYCYCSWSLYSHNWKLTKHMVIITE